MFARAVTKSALLSATFTGHSSSAINIARAPALMLNSSLRNLFFSTTPTVTATTTSTSVADASVVDTLGPKLTFASHPFPINGTPIENLNSPSIESDRFAIIEFSGTQYKVTLDDTIVADKQSKIDIGDIISLDKVLLVGSRKGTLMGRPYIEGAKVMAAVEEISKDKKLTIFKMRRRKNSRRKKGFRRSVTVLRIQSIILDDQHKEFNDKL